MKCAMLLLETVYDSNRARVKVMSENIITRNKVWFIALAFQQPKNGQIIFADKNGIMFNLRREIGRERELFRRRCFFPLKTAFFSFMFYFSKKKSNTEKVWYGEWS